MTQKIVSLGGTKNVVTTPQQTTTLTQVTLIRIVDNPSEKFVRAFIEEIGNPITLWEGDAYDSIGDWTQAKADKQLAALINAM